MIPTHLSYRAEVDGLRAVAVLAVVCFHAFPDWLKGGFIGVDVFFVISGYLITRILAQQFGQNNFNLIPFYQRRIQRIFPALALVLIASMIAGWFWMFPNEYLELGTETTAGSGFFSNFYFWKISGYFDSSAEQKPLLHLWSLAVEEQFYLLWPTVLALSFRFKINSIRLISVIAALSLYWCLSTAIGDSAQAFYSPMVRIWELMAGAILVFTPDIVNHLKNTISFLGLLLIVFSVFMLNRFSVWPGYWTLVPVFGTVMLIGSRSDSWVHRRILSVPFLVKIGLISYPLYLWHWVLLYFGRLHFGAELSVVIRLLLILISFLLAWITEQWIEKPIRYGNLQKKSTWILIPLMLVIGITGWLIRHQRWIETRMIDREMDQIYYSKNLETDSNCIAKFGKNFQYCKLSQSGDPTVALIGDSFAHSYFVGFSEKLNQHGENLAMLGSAGCPPLIGITSFRKGEQDCCKNGGTQAIRWLFNQPKIHTVILAANWNLYIHGNRFSQPNERWFIKSSENVAISNVDVFKSQFQQTLNELQKMGKKIIFIKQNPENKLDLRYCLQNKSNQSVMNQDQCRIDAQSQKSYLASYEFIVDPILTQHSGVKVIDPFPVFCDSNQCRWIHEGRLLFRDQLHLTIDGSRYFADHADLL